MSVNPNRSPESFYEGLRGAIRLINRDGRDAIDDIRTGKTQRDVGKQIAHKMDFHPIISDLNRTPNSRFDTEMLAKRLLAKYEDPAQIKKAIDHILANDPRFNNSTKEFAVNKKQFEDLKQQVDSQYKASLPKDAVQKQKAETKQLNKSLQIDFPLTQKEKDKAVRKQSYLRKNIGTDLVGLINRQPTEATHFRGTDGKNHFMKQTPGHMQDGKFIPGHTVSSNLSNKDAKVLELPNQAVITFHSKNTNPFRASMNPFRNDNPLQADEVILGRSGRSDRESKVEDKSLLDITERLKSKTQRGLKRTQDKQGNTYYEYQRADITMMDTNLIKSSATKALSTLKHDRDLIKGKSAIPVESERHFVHAKRKAIRKKWAQGVVDPERGNRRYIDRDVDIEGKSYKVREYEPLVWNFVFSSSANRPSNIITARKDNIPNALYLFAELQKNNPQLKDLFSKFDTSSRLGRQQLSEMIKRELNNPNQNALTEDQIIALKAVLVTLTGRDEFNRNYDNKDGSDVQYILLNHLADLTGTAITVECKSGNDRTATAMALRCAIKEFESTHAKRYDPTAKDGSDLNIIKHLFNKYAIEFGAPNVKASRGMDERGIPVLKTYTSPVFRKYGDMDELKKFFNIT